MRSLTFLTNREKTFYAIMLLVALLMFGAAILSGCAALSGLVGDGKPVPVAGSPEADPSQSAVESALTVALGSVVGPLAPYVATLIIGVLYALGILKRRKLTAVAENYSDVIDVVKRENPTVATVAMAEVKANTHPDVKAAAEKIYQKKKLKRKLKAA